MRISVVVHGAPYSSQAPLSALKFCRAVAASDHQLHRVFFYHAAALTGSAVSVAPQDDVDVAGGWRTFAEDTGTELAVCIAAALKRGVLDDAEAGRYELPHGNLDRRFQIVGLGQLIEAIVESDRTVTFA